MLMAGLRYWAAVLTLLLGAGALAAEDASPWDGDARSAVRLIAGSRPPGAATVRAGIEVRLKPGWHTYWRYPGDAGVPPRFDFLKSRNIKTVQVLWPAPQRISEQGLTAIGYAGSLILPLMVEPQDAAKPVILRVNLGYAVCEKLCVPAEARVELTLGGGASRHEAALAAAQARVPKKLALGEGSKLVIRSVRRDESSVPPRVIVDVAGPTGTDLFAEGPTAEWALPLPTLTAGAAPGLHRFVFAREGAPAGADFQGAQLTLTAVAGHEAIEVAARLD